MINTAEIKIKIFRLVDAQDGETLEQVYQMLLERLQPQSDEEREEEIRHFYADSGSFSFWEDEREDLYQDYLEKAQQ